MPYIIAMDSLTQLALGGAIGAAVGGKKYGRKAALIGAICGTIPDLDIFFSSDDPVTAFTHHRGLSHSFLFAIFGTPVFAWIFSKIKWLGVQFKDRALHVMVFLGLFTHMLLDALTIYGTQLFWPLPTPPIAVGSVFIIDLLYTLPLLVGLIWFLFNKSRHIPKVALAVSTLYLAWGLAAQQIITNKLHESHTVAPSQVLVQTTPFNTFLWRILVMDNDGYKVGYASIFDKGDDILLKHYSSQPALLSPLADTYAVQRLNWFTNGFYKAHQQEDKIIMTDLRMGREPDSYIFGFVIGLNNGQETTPTTNQRFSSRRDMGTISQIWDRIWDEDISLQLAEK